MYCLSFDKIELKEREREMLKETEGNEWKSLSIVTITCISVLMPLKKLLVLTPNFCIQANTSRLPTSYPANLFAWGRLFYVHRGALIIALF